MGEVECSHSIDVLIEAELKLALMTTGQWPLQTWQSRFPDLAVGLPMQQEVSCYHSRPSSAGLRLPNVWLHLRVVFIAEGWSGGALPRWRPPLTPGSPI